eukprot:5468766-Lingulodinium_polyedra.AAC.1
MPAASLTRSKALAPLLPALPRSPSTLHTASPTRSAARLAATPAHCAALSTMPVPCVASVRPAVSTSSHGAP